MTKDKRNERPKTFAPGRKGHLPYDPGVIPSKCPPRAGTSLSIRVDGLPPYKDLHFSIRNPKHKVFSRFVLLRQAAIAAMRGRAPFPGPIRLDFVLRCQELEQGKSLLDYASGIEDTLDGSHGFCFTYLPIVFEDDCQVCFLNERIVPSSLVSYDLEIHFLDQDQKEVRMSDLLDA